jgi:hypothetical protein
MAVTLRKAGGTKEREWDAVTMWARLGCTGEVYEGFKCWVDMVKTIYVNEFLRTKRLEA